jgi:hypothetical protein
VSVLATVYSAAWEYSVRKYLEGFADAVVPDFIPDQEKINYILNWMGHGPPRIVATDPATLSERDPETTLNYKQLLTVCGSATNAFINLARSSDLQTRRLLLLGPDDHVRHVVAEVLLDHRWVIVDPAFRILLKDSQGRPLTRKELKDPAVLREATLGLVNYLPDYNYENVAHVHLSRVPVVGRALKRALDSGGSGWEDAVDWTLLLERRSFFFLIICFCCSFFLLTLRFLIAWYADSRIGVERFRLWTQLQRAGSALFFTPEIK